MCVRFLANGRVRSLSSPVVEGEAAATVSTEPNAAAAALTHQRTQVNAHNSPVLI